MTDLRKAAEMALDKLLASQVCHHNAVETLVEEAIKALRTALAQPDSTSDSATRSADSAESFCKQELHDLMSVAGRMALELECLLLDTKNMSAVSKWWDTGMESLQAYRDYIWSITHGKSEESLSTCERCGEVNPAEIHTCTPKVGQEPVAYWNGGNTEDESEDFMYPKTRQAHIDHPESFTHTFYQIPLYTAPPKRKWVGLTDDDIADAWELIDGEITFARAIEAKVKELNT